LVPGTIIGERYRIVEPLARGGFGAVYVAEQLTTERRVALKVLARYAENISVERLLAEARVTSRILSDHIVQVIDAGVDAASGSVFVVMELLHGVTLDDRVMDGGPLSAEETVECLRQIASGLDKAHAHVDRGGRPAPIIHRDLKPSNVFLTQRDDGRRLVKILDFGAAKVLSRTTKASGVIRGTPQFMASEQALGEQSSQATDIWALGLIAFYLLTGQSYWLSVQQDGTQSQLFAEIVTRPLLPASLRARQLGVAIELPAELDAWFFQCVNRNPAARFKSAGLAVAELSRALGVAPEPLRISDTPRRERSAAQVTTTADRRSKVGQPLETQELAVLSSTPGLARSPRGRAGLVALGVVLAAAAGAAVVGLWKRAPVSEPPPRSISGSAALSAVGGLPAGATTGSAPPPAAPIETVGAVPAASVPSVTRALPPPATLAPRAAKRGASAVRRPQEPTKPATPPRDPYEQR
jgi:serine/threonine-protein kinase